MLKLLQQHDLRSHARAMQLDHPPERIGGLSQAVLDIGQGEAQLPQRFDLLQAGHVADRIQPVA